MITIIVILSVLLDVTVVVLTVSDAIAIDVDEPKISSTKSGGAKIPSNFKVPKENIQALRRNLQVKILKRERHPKLKYPPTINMKISRKDTNSSLENYRHINFRELMKNGEEDVESSHFRDLIEKSRSGNITAGFNITPTQKYSKLRRRNTNKITVSNTENLKQWHLTREE